MIIAVNGYSGSGKDLVGKICLWLLNSSKLPLPFELWGKEEIRWWNPGEWEIKKFADVANNCCEIITGINFLKLPREEKELHRDKFRDFANKTKEVFGEDVWANALFSKYEPVGRRTWQDPDDSNINYPNWIITDLRFPNEFKAVKDRGGIVIRINRLCNICGGTEHHKMDCSNNKLKHPSETALDNYDFDYEIDNNGSVEDLIEKIKYILKKESLL